MSRMGVQKAVLGAALVGLTAISCGTGATGDERLGADATPTRSSASPADTPSPSTSPAPGQSWEARDGDLYIKLSLDKERPRVGETVTFVIEAKADDGRFNSMKLSHITGRAPAILSIRLVPCIKEGVAEPSDGQVPIKTGWREEHANTTQVVHAVATATSCLDGRTRSIEVSGEVFVAAAS